MLSVSGVSTRPIPSGRAVPAAGSTSTESGPSSAASSAASGPPPKSSRRPVVGRRCPAGDSSRPPASAFTRVDLPDPEGPITVTTGWRSKRAAIARIMRTVSSH